MTEGNRVFGANRNPITGLVRRHADHKNSRKVMWAPDIYTSSSFADREEQKRERERGQQVCSFVNPLKPPYFHCVHPNLSL